MTTIEPLQPPCSDAQTFRRGDFFTIKPEALTIYGGERLDGIVFTVKSVLGAVIVAKEKALRTAVSDWEIQPHPGPATPEADTPKARRKPRTHDYRTPAQLAQAEFYAAIRAHKLTPESAVQILTDTAAAIQSLQKTGDNA